jgi:effector-binding domain-containing protein
MKAILVSLLLAGWATAQVGQAYEAAYPMTPAGFCEIKKLPAGTVLRTSMRGGYFDENNNLFRRLFDAINRNRVPMTVPVEAKMMPGTMVFYLDSASAKRKDLQLPAGVIRQTLPPRAVASIGVRGGYTRESYEENLAKLREWLKKQNKYRAAGEPYAVYWNGPFTLAPFKRSEVHLPVQKIN